MRKILCMTIGILMICSQATALQQFHKDFRKDQNFANHTKEVKNDLLMRIDYGSRTDSQPVYLGYARRSVATSDNAWIIFFFTYDGSDRLTLKQSSYGTWDDRASHTYE